MENLKVSRVDIQQLLAEMVQLQQEKVLSSARRIIPTLTTDDILQPNDFPELENHPHFRYEEGVLEGIKSVQMALRFIFTTELTENFDNTEG